MEDQQHLQQLVEELQMSEHLLQQTLAQKQSLHIEHAEVENATREVAKTSGAVFKITGGVMIESNKSTIQKELLEKEKMLHARLEAIQKQEKNILERTTKIRNELQSAVDKSKKK